MLIELDEQETQMLREIIQAILVNPQPQFPPDAVRFLERIDGQLPREW